MTNAQEESLVSSAEIFETEVKEMDNIFSQPWKDSDVVLVVEGKEFHVHRYFLSLQSPVFKAMFNGNFNDAKQDKIELKDDKYRAMFKLFKLLYPTVMLGVEGEVKVGNRNVLEILEVADKYGAIDVIKRCMSEARRLKPENTMRLLPYAIRHELPVEDILAVVASSISTDKLKNFAPELSNDSLYNQTLERKCRLQEKVITEANTILQYLLKKYVDVQLAKDSSKTTAKCFRHPFKALNVQDFKKAKACTHCLAAYRKCYLDKYVCSPFAFGARISDTPSPSSISLMQLLKQTDDIASSLQS